MSDTADLVVSLAPVRTEATTYLEHARLVPIDDDETFAAAAALLLKIKRLRQTVDELFRPHVARALQAHRALLADRQKLDAPLAQAEAALKDRLASFTEAEEARRRHEAALETVAAQERRRAAVWTEVEALEHAGAPEEAAALVDDFVRTAHVAPVIVAQPLKAPGLQRREVWRYEVIDAAQLPREYLTIDHAKLGGVVRALKAAASIPGVRIWVERAIAASRRV